MNIAQIALFASLAAAISTPNALAQRGNKRTGSSAEIGVRTAPEDAGISWFGTWDAALAEAKRTSRPIFLMSAAPTCHEVPGVW